MKQVTWTKDDYASMAEAIVLARKGLYTTDPNPRVGCVIVNQGRIVGRGWHKQAGGAHAEVAALAEAGAKAKNAEVFVSLEPCSHVGKTPPCVDALIKAGVSRVVVAMSDPNPIVNGKGLKLLESAGIKIESGLLSAQARDLNPGFIKRMCSKRPWVRIKMAMSVDGRTAMKSGESQWITGPEARSDVQRLRARSSAILTGSGTILSDDASLTIRDEELGLNNFEVAAKLQPLRVLLDLRGRVAEGARLFSQPGQVLWVVSESAQVPDKILERENVELLRIPICNFSERLDTVLKLLAERGCNELLVEGGPTLFGSFLQHNCWDELVLYMAPKLMGSEANAMANLPLKQLSDAKSLELRDIRMVGSDIRLDYRPVIADNTN